METGGGTVQVRRDGSAAAVPAFRPVRCAEKRRCGAAGCRCAGAECCLFRDELRKDGASELRDERRVRCVNCSPDSGGRRFSWKNYIFAA